MNKTPFQLAVALLIVCALPLAAAEWQLISNQTYTTGSTLELDTGTYTISISSGNVTSLLLTRENESIIVDEGVCKRFDYELLCHEDKLASSSRIVLYDLRAQVNIDTDYNETGPFIPGDLFESNMTMTNIGGRETQAQLIMALPENLVVTEHNPCDYNGTHITWQELLLEDDEETCDLIFRVDGDIEATLRAEATYMTFDARRFVNSTEQDIEASFPFDFNYSVEDSEGIEPGRPFTVRFSMNNTGDDNISFSPIELIFPKDVTVRSTTITNAKTSSTKIWMTTKLKPEESFEGEVVLAINELNASGTMELRVSYKMQEEDVTRTFVKTMSYESIHPPIEITIKPDVLTFEAYSPVALEAYARNPMAYYSYKGYDVQITSTLLGQPITRKVPYDRNRKLADITFTAPAVTANQEQAIDVRVTATTDDNDRFVYNQRFIITITPLRGIMVEKNVERSDDGLVSVTTTVTNKHDNAVTATFNEQLPAGVFVKGSTTATASLGPEEPTIIYAYEVFTDEPLIGDIPFITQYDYVYLGQSFTKQQQVLIEASAITGVPEKPVQPPISPNATVNNATTITDERVERAAPSLIHIIIASAVLFVIVIVISVWEWMRHVHAFKIRHKTIIKQYQGLIDEGSLLRQRKQELLHEQELLKRKLELLERHVNGYDHNLPYELDKLKHQRDDLRTIDATVKERHERLRKEIERLTQREKEIISYENNISGLVGRIEDRARHLQFDRESLHTDVTTLHGEQQQMNEALTGLAKQQEFLSDRIKHFKAKHVSNINSKIRILAKQRKKTLDYHRRLEEEEELIKREFERVQQDLQISKDDLERAEKLYKEASLELRKEQHDANLKQDNPSQG